MVPEGWKVKQLADICSKQISYGIVQTGEHQPNGIPCLRVVDLTKDEMHTEEMIRTSVEIHKSYRKTILKKDEIVMALRGEVGLVRQIDTKLVGANITRGLARISAKPHIVAPEFLLWELRSPKFRADLMRRVGGSALQEISLSELRKVQTLIPPLPEQKKIAQILSTWDKAITTTEQLLANSQQQKKALMQQLLTGKKRLLDENGIRFSGEWKKVRLGTVADMNSGGTPKSNIEEYYGGNIPWVSIADMTKQVKWIASTEKYLTELGLENSSARIYPRDSVLYAMYASIGECSIAQVPLSSSQAILGIRPKSELNFEFLYFFFNSLKEKIQLQGQQGTQSNLNAGMVKDFLLYLPGMEEQKKIAAVLCTADQEISALQQKLDAFKQEKKALMQQLLTGKRRVRIDNKEVA